MAEASSGITHPISQESLPRIFYISPKSSHAWITEHIKEKSRSDFNKKITDDIIANAMEAEPGVAWPEIIGLASYVDDGQGYRGRSALAKRFTRAINSTAYSMGWDMSSPQVVYMSIHALIIPVSERLNALNEDTNAIERGTHSFPTNEQRQQRLDAEMQEAGRLGAFIKRLSETAEKYADEFIPKGSEYRNVLKKIIHTGHVSAQKERRVAQDRLRRGDVTGALKKLSEIKFKKNY